MNQHQANGFTLLELLLTLVLFSTILALLLGSFVQLQDQDAEISDVLKLRQEARILEKLIRRDFQAAVYLNEFMILKPKLQDNRQSGIVAINDSYDNMDRDIVHMHVHKPSDFIRTLDIAADPELHEVSYYIDEADPDNPKFTRREEFYIDTDITDGDRSITHILSEHVTGFNLLFYRGKDPEKVEEWDSEKESTRIPAGLEVTLDFQYESGERLKTVFQILLQPTVDEFIKWKN